MRLEVRGSRPHAVIPKGGKIRKMKSSGLISHARAEESCTFRAIGVANYERNLESTCHVSRWSTSDFAVISRLNTFADKSLMLRTLIESTSVCLVTAPRRFSTSNR